MYLMNKTLLRVLQERKAWERLWPCITLDRFDKEIRLVLNSINKYYKDVPDAERIDSEVFAGKFFLRNQFDDDEREVYQEIIKIMSGTPDPDIAKELVRDLRELQFTKECEDALNAFALGEDIDVYETVRQLTSDFEKDVRRDVSDEYCTDSIRDICEDENNGIRIKWPLKCLNGAIPNSGTGKQYIVAARPGKGKTSFLAHLCVHALGQEDLRELGRPAVWFNNEGKKRSIKGNAVRAALGMGFDDMAKLGWDEADRRYINAIGDPNAIRIYDIHGKDYSYLERIIERDNPIIVVADMLDNVHGVPGGVRADREDQRLESLYKWLRESAVIYDFMALPTSQVSVEGADMQWIPESALKDSKTGKQGACDGIITIGTDPSPGFERSRFIYVPKSKATPAPGFSADCRTQVIFDGKTSRYLNPKEV